MLKLARKPTEQVTVCICVLQQGGDVDLKSDSLYLCVAARQWCWPEKWQFVFVFCSKAWEVTVDLRSDSLYLCIAARPEKWQFVFVCCSKAMTLIWGRWAAGRCRSRPSRFTGDLTTRETCSSWRYHCSPLLTPSVFSVFACLSLSISWCPCSCLYMSVFFSVFSLCFCLRLPPSLFHPPFLFLSLPRWPSG